MTRKIPPAADDTVYQIISGYYPDIVSGPRGARGTGTTGSTGAKYKLQPGYTDSSIEKLKFEENKREDPQFAESEFIRQREEGYKGRKTVGLGYRKIMDEQNVFTGKYAQYYKWTGGSDKYRLFGDMVWYMHGKRNSESIENFVKGFGKNTPQFSNIYAKSEGNLAKTAKVMANDIVDAVVDDVAKKEMKRRIDVWNADGQWNPSGEGDHAAMAPEEMGFTIGNTEYKSTPAAKKTQDGIGKIAKGSMANVIDMVKIVDGEVVEVMDVTEEEITKTGQHGISEGMEGLTELEGVIEKFALDTTDPNSEPILAIKQAVTNLFQKAIDNEYNPIISKLTSYAKKTGDKSKSRWEQVLKQVQKDSKKKPGKKVGEPDITKAAGLTYGKTTTLKGGADTVNQTSMQYITHMLGTMGGNAGAAFSQSHRVADYPEGPFSGQSLYATVPMKMDDETLLFDREIVTGTTVLAGYSATLAQSVNKGELQSSEALEISRGQKQAWQYQRVTGGTNPRAGAVFTASQKGLQQHAYHSTSVSAIAGPALQKILEAIVQTRGAELGKLTRKINPELGKNPYYWNPGQGKKGGSGKRATRLKKGTSNTGGGNTMFWALPYIGIQQSEYTGK